MRLSLHKLPLKGEFGCGLVAGVLAVYFLMVFPAVQFFLRPITPFAAHAYSLYLAAALLFLVVWKKIPPQRLALAWPPPRSHVVMGAGAAALPVLALPLLDATISALGLDDTELFKGAALRQADQIEGAALLLWGVLIVPVLKQTFFTGFVAQYLIRRYDPALGIYLAGLVFGLAHFKLSFGLFALGLVSAGLLRMTGTLYAPILFHLGCSLAGEWLVRDYARLVTLLGFLF